MLEREGYFNITEIEGRGVCALYRFAFTVGLVINITDIDYKGRYCYPELAEAKAAINAWDGKNDPSGNWVKYKGIDGERRNENFI